VSQAVIPPPLDFVSRAHVSSAAQAQAFRETAMSQPQGFWRELSRALVWEKPFTEVLKWQMPVAEWFVGGKINVSKNCLDRHLRERGDKTAVLWEAEPLGPSPQTRRLSYRELHALTCQIANAFRSKGLKKGDRVAIYMPMVPETIATMLACARIGAIHTVVFGGFSAQALADRVHASGAEWIVCANGTYRKGKFLNLKTIVDEAYEKAIHSKSKMHTAKHCLVFLRDAQQPCHWVEERDLSWETTVLTQSSSCEPEALDSEDPLFILYTSGTTGKPKGLYHTQAGYLLWAHWSSRWLFDLKDDDLYWCTADCGWITGHTYVTYGPLSNGASIFMYEGAPTTPTPDRYWQMIDQHKVSILYTAPTAVRLLMACGNEPVLRHKLTSLRLLGSVGEPINPEAWHWFHEVVGKSRCPIVDTWWQTETGGAMIAPFPGATPLKPSYATQALPGIDAAILDPETGAEKPVGEKGLLCIRKPWPSMARGIWGDPERFEATYWNTTPALKGFYATADFAIRDSDGDFCIEGRMDDVLKVAGHRIGSAEIESALVGHAHVAEAAAIGIPDAVKGESIVVFVTLGSKHIDKNLSGDKASATSAERETELVAELKAQVVQEIGPLARPDRIHVVASLPKTRSGKIMRRLLRELATTGRISGDTSTLADDT
jgi:acetyl-CoA synthetase